MATDEPAAQQFGQPDAEREQNRFRRRGSHNLVRPTARRPPGWRSAAGDFEPDLMRVLVTSTRSDSLQRRS